MNTPTCVVFIGTKARQDIREIVAFLVKQGAAERAQRVLDDLTEALESLTQWPERGARPRELESLSGDDVRQLNVGIYRVIYVLQETTASVLMIVDGRRDVGHLLRQRLGIE